MLPDIHANNARVMTTITLVPAASPSMPSVRLAPFETAVTIMMTIGIKIRQANYDMGKMFDQIGSSISATSA